MKPNAELAYLVLDHIDADPNSWNQRRWVCGTAACFGGWAIQLGANATVEYMHSAEVTSGPDELIGMSAEDAANDVLGLASGFVGNDYEAEWLYDSAHTREDLGRLVAEIFGPRPRPWTPDEKTETGTRIYVKRACNGCGELLGDVTEAEMDRAVTGLPAEDVTAECPRCRPAGDAS